MTGGALLFIATGYHGRRKDFYGNMIPLWDSHQQQQGPFKDKRRYNVGWRVAFVNHEIQSAGKGWNQDGGGKEAHACHLLPSSDRWLCARLRR